MYGFVNTRIQKIVGLLGALVVIGAVLSACSTVSPGADPPPESPPAAGEAADPAPEPRDTAPSGETPEPDDGRAAGESRGAPTTEPDDRSAGVRRERPEPGMRRPPLGEPDDETAVDRAVASLSLREKIGQMIMPGMPVTELTPALETMLRDVRPGGFILFAANIETPDQVRRLVTDLHATVGVPLLIATDQEGGVVRRVVPTAAMPATAIPAAARVGAVGDPRLAVDLARVVARELRSLGIRMNFAPVADVLTNENNPVIGSRAFGSNPETVAEMVAATVRGLQSEGVSAVAKHFPGHGDTVQDSHQEAAYLPHGLDRLRRVELVPFVEAIDAGVDAIMTGHITVPAVSRSALPATLDPTIVTGLLRERLGFNGVIVSDSLTMAAVTRYYEPQEVAVRAVEAGVDILLRPGRPRVVQDALLEAVADGRIPESRIDQSVRRILRLKVERGLLRIGPGEPPRLLPTADLIPAAIEMGTPAHQAIVEQVFAEGG